MISKFNVTLNRKPISICNYFLNLRPSTTKTKIAGVYTVNTNVWLPEEQMKDRVEEGLFIKLSKDYYLSK